MKIAGVRNANLQFFIFNLNFQSHQSARKRERYFSGKLEGRPRSIDQHVKRLTGRTIARLARSIS